MLAPVLLSPVVSSFDCAVRCPAYVIAPLDRTYLTVLANAQRRNVDFLGLFLMDSCHSPCVATQAAKGVGANLGTDIQRDLETWWLQARVGSRGQKRSLLSSKRPRIDVSA